MKNNQKSKPFIILTHISINKNEIRNYIEVAEQTLFAYKETETNLLHQTIDQDPDNCENIVWTEVFKDDSALIKHLENPPLALYLANHYQLGTNIRMEIFGDISKVSNDKLKERGIDFKIYQTKLGYSNLVIK